MNHEEKVLFDEYFYMRKDVRDNKVFFDYILNIILNSKEFVSSPLKISEEEAISTLLGLVVTPLGVNSYNSSFSLMYCVSDGKNHENRTMNGVIDFSSINGVTITSEMSRFNSHGFVGSFNIFEFFSLKNGIYEKFYDYSGTDFCGFEYIDSDSFIKSEKFKNRTVKLMKERNRK